MGIFLCIFKDFLNILKYNIEYILSILLITKWCKIIIIKIIKWILNIMFVVLKGFVVGMVNLGKFIICLRYIWNFWFIFIYFKK